MLARCLSAKIKMSSLLSFFITLIARKWSVVMETEGQRLLPGCFFSIWDILLYLEYLRIPGG